MGLVFVRLWIALVCFINFSRQLNTNGDCKAWCVTEEEKRSSEIEPCDFDFEEYPYPFEDQMEPVELHDFDVQLQCRGNSTLGFSISWKVKGQDILNKKVENFFIEFMHMPSYPRGKPNKEVAIGIPKNVVPCKEVRFEYFFSGVKDEFFMTKGEGFIILLRSKPGYVDGTSYTVSVTIPVLLHGISGCKKEYDQVTNTTDTEETPKPLTELKLGLILSAVVLLIMIIALTIIISKKFRNQQNQSSEEPVPNTHSLEETSTEKMFYILLNPGILDNNMKYHVTKIATKLSREANHITNAKTNLWETVGITTEDFIEQLMTDTRSADVIILVSVPDSVEKTLDYERYNNVFNIILKRAFQERSRKVEIVIAHGEDKEKHSSCPFVKCGLYKVVKIKGDDDDWKELLDHITENEIEEKYPDTPLLN